MRLFITAVILTASGCLSAQCFEKIFSGNQYFIAISQDGSLWGWGENGNRQLGIGTVADQDLLVLISSASWQSVAAGTTHTLAVKSDGTLWAWGSDSYEKLGNGSSDNASVPQQIGTANDWKEVVAGERGSLALKTNGTLWGWGTNANGYLGNNAATTYESNVPIQIGTASDWAHIAGSDSRHALAIKMNGTLWAWGQNNAGQVGNATVVDQFTPVQIGVANNWNMVEAGSSLSFALKTDNTLWAWGASSAGVPVNQTQPTQIGTDSNWQSFSLNKYDTFQYTLMTKTNGTLWAWGSDNYEQLGNGTAENYASPTQIGTATDWLNVTAGHRQGCAVKTDGTFWTWGDTELVGDGTETVDVPTQYACTALSIHENDLISIILYPNPASAWLNLSGADIKAAAAYDLSGRQYHLVPQGNAFDISALAAGLYILSAETEAGTFNGRFIKQ